jgi:DNA-3-methyladenine glycosylase II
VASDPWSEAIEHLRGCDPRWTPILDRVGPCTLRGRRDRFGILVRAIIGQQISTRAAATIDARLRVLSGEPHDPVRLIAAGEEALRSCGLSGVKARYVLNLSEAVRGGHLPLSRIGRLGDNEVKSKLTAIKGIGPWTAEMFLIFSLGRPDVLSTGDLGVRVGIRNFHGLAEMPSPRECEQLSEPWRPFRSIAMWYLWRVVDAPKATG